jgi:Sugar (and other) transporter
MDKFGRRPALMISILPLVLGWILLATASSHFMIIFGRIVAGIAVGICGAPAQVCRCASKQARHVHNKNFVIKRKNSYKLRNILSARLSKRQINLNKLDKFLTFLHEII